MTAIRPDILQINFKLATWKEVEAVKKAFKAIINNGTVEIEYVVHPWEYLPLLKINIGPLAGICATIQSRTHQYVWSSRGRQI